MTFVESPGNPTNGPVDSAMVRRVAGGHQQGPGAYADRRVRRYAARAGFLRPIEHGADISLYSLTKYIGGHSDLIAGAALGSKP